MRGLAILAVIIIHVTAEATIAYPSDTTRFISYNIINSLAQFAVPVFLFISSVVLTWKQTKEEVPLSKFYTKRLKTVIVPYLVWSTFYFILKTVCFRGSTALSLNFIGRELVNGTAYYHLYFLLIVIQLYLFIPLVCTFIKKMKSLHMIVLTLFLQVLFYILNKAWIYEIYPHPANLLGSYLSVFVVGCWIGANYQKVKAVFLKYKVHLWSLSLLVVICYVIINIKLRMNEPVGLIVYYGAYHLFALFSSLSIWLFFVENQSSFFNIFGAQSFPMYLIHPLFLGIWNTLWHAIGFSTNDFLYLTGLLFTVVFSYVASCIFTKWKLLSKIFLAR